MTFKSRKDGLFTCIVIGTVLVLTGLTIAETISTDGSLLPVYIVNIFVIGFLLWLWMDTSYRIGQTHFYYRSGPFKGKIEINKIREVVRDKTAYIGLKPALAQKGLIIKYEKYNDIYISPLTNDTFISYLLTVNPDIKITKG